MQSSHLLLFDVEVIRLCFFVIDFNIFLLLKPETSTTLSLTEEEQAHDSVGVRLTVYLERHYTLYVSLKSLHPADVSLFILLSPACLQRRSQRSPPAVRWRSNRKCRQTPKTQESSIPEPSSTDPRVCTTCLLWPRRWHMAPTYTLRVKRKRGKRRSFRQ